MELRSILMVMTESYKAPSPSWICIFGSSFSSIPLERLRSFSRGALNLHSSHCQQHTIHPKMASSSVPASIIREWSPRPCTYRPSSCLLPVRCICCAQRPVADDFQPQHLLRQRSATRCNDSLQVDLTKSPSDPDKRLATARLVS